MTGRKWQLALLAAGCVAVLAFYAGGWSPTARTKDNSRKRIPNAARISALLAEMETANLDSMPALPVEKFALPTSSVDVMRVRLEETYDIEGVGRDTVALKGWIAVRHDDPQPAAGQTEVKWGTAVSNTEFVGMDLRGESKIFGPVIITLNPDMPSKGQVGKLDLPESELEKMHAAYVNMTSTSAPLPPQQPLKIAEKGYEGIVTTLEAVRKAIESQNPEAMLRQYDKNPNNTFFNGGASRKFRGAKNYIDFLAPQFTSTKIGVRFNDIRVIEGTPSRWAVVEVSGTNTTLKDSEGQPGGEVPFYLTQVYVKSGQRWLIKHDSWSPTIDATTISTMKAVSTRAAACRATAAVLIKMPRLDLTMKTKAPVVWYSEVETIPPVGYSASVSFAPTALETNQRNVGTLVSGIVKFREVVKKVSLDSAD